MRRMPKGEHRNAQFKDPLIKPARFARGFAAEDDAHRRDLAHALYTRIPGQDAGINLLPAKAPCDFHGEFI